MTKAGQQYQVKRKEGNLHHLERNLLLTKYNKKRNNAKKRNNCSISTPSKFVKQRSKVSVIVNYVTFFLCRNAINLFNFFSDLAELRKKFELDKKRLQELKVKRTFKPF